MEFCSTGVFCVWLISLSIMSSRFIHVAACVKISFLLRLNNIPLYIYTIFCLSSHLLMDTWVVSRAKCLLSQECAHFHFYRQHDTQASILLVPSCPSQSPVIWLQKVARAKQSHIRIEVIRKKRGRED